MRLSRAIAFCWSPTVRGPARGPSARAPAGSRSPELYPAADRDRLRPLRPPARQAAAALAMASPIAEGIYIVGVGMTPVGEHWETSLRHLALEAIQTARAGAGGLGPQLIYVANMLAPALSGPSPLGTLGG